MWDPDDGSVEVVDGCVVDYPGEFLSEPVLCPDGSPLFGQGVVVSQDGTRFGAGALVPRGEPMPFRFWDASTLEPLTTIEIPTSGRIDWGTPFLDDDSLVLLEGDPGGQLDSAYRVYNPDTGELIATLDQTREWRGACVITADGTAALRRFPEWRGVGVRHRHVGPVAFLAGPGRAAARARSIAR